MTSEEEFKQVLIDHGDAAYRMALQLTGGREAEARDLTQDVFIRVWQRWDTPRPTSMRGWLYRVLKNRHIDQIRRQKRHPMASLDDTQQTDTSLADRLPDRALSPTALLERKALQHDVRSALQALPDEYRIPVTLCDIEEQSYEDIAKALDCPIGTVRSRIHRGRQALKERLQLKRWWLPAAALALVWGWLSWRAHQQALRMSTPPEIVKTVSEKVIVWHTRERNGVN